LEKEKGYKNDLLPMKTLDVESDLRYLDFFMAQLPYHSLTLERCYAIHAPSANFSRGAEGEHRGDATVHGLVEVEGSIRGQENDAFISLEGHEGRDEQRCGLPWPNESDQISKKPWSGAKGMDIGAEREWKAK